MAAENTYRGPWLAEPSERRSTDLSVLDSAGQMENGHALATRRRIAERCAAFSRSQSNGSGLKHAAVAIAVVDTIEASGLSILLTLRAAGLRAHSKQWALPGGRCDEGETAVTASLRELQEELGLVLTPDDVLGVLDDYPTRSGFLITPVVIWAVNFQKVVANSAEVASVHSITIADLERADAFEFTAILESERKVIRYRYGDKFIHAPTAALIYQFREVLAGRATRVTELEQPVFAWK
jgi:8-oxo-dGTP pyrophosphatase MutT (NUDIX family)